MFDAIKRFFRAGSPKAQKLRYIIAACPDCEARSGEFHDLFCLKERCPFCSGQLAACDCIRTVLNLSDAECRALDEYVDDSVPPLSDVMRRWRESLHRKGRVPFEAFPDDPIRAAYRGDVEAVQRFLEDGHPPDSGNEVGYTVLMGAARGERLNVVQLILSRGGQASIADKRGFSALHWAVAQPPSQSSSQLSCVRALIEAGADSNAQNEDGVTPLMNAAWYGCRDSVEELLRCGADSSVCDPKGRSARELAAERGHVDIEDLLK